MNKISLRFLHIRIIIFSAMCIVLSLLNLVMEGSLLSYILSAFVIFVCLFVSLFVFRTSISDKIVRTPIIEESYNSFDVKYEIPGILPIDIKRLHEALTEWKEKNSFDWVYHKGEKLYAGFTDKKKKDIKIYLSKRANSQGQHPEIVRYDGIFRYYMEEEDPAAVKHIRKVRKFKINQIQLGTLDLGVISDIDTYANKYCSIVIDLANNEILDIQIKEEKEEA